MGAGYYGHLYQAAMSLWLVVLGATSALTITTAKIIGSIVVSGQKCRRLQLAAHYAHWQPRLPLFLLESATCHVVNYHLICTFNFDWPRYQPILQTLENNLTVLKPDWHQCTPVHRLVQSVSIDANSTTKLLFTLVTHCVLLFGQVVVLHVSWR